MLTYDIQWGYNPFLVYCRELASGTVSLTGDRAQGDDSKNDSHYRGLNFGMSQDLSSFTLCLCEQGS